MKKGILISIFLLSAVVRLYNIGEFPALNADEAAIGYNAFSLLETGMDEHGNPWPLHFQSFNDFKPGLIFYMVLPFIKFFGLNALSVRILPALIGSITPLILYFFVKQLRIQHLELRNSSLEFISAGLLAISPWHIHFSRGAWEVNIATFFMLAGAWAFLVGMKSKKWLIASILLFTLSLYTYHSARLVVPLLAAGLLFTNKRAVIKTKKNFAIALVIGFIAVIPLGHDLLSSEALSRASGVGLLADPGPLNRVNELRGHHEVYTGGLARIMHNKATSYTLAFLENWGEHYWGEFLFLSGDDIERNKVPETGQMLLFALATVPIGLVAIARKSKGWGVVLWWLLIAPTAAALTFQSPHALRAQNMVIPLTIISAYGAMRITDFAKKLKNKSLVNASLIIFTLIIALSFTRYARMYWLHMAKEYKFSSQYGVEELVSFTSEKKQEFEKILVTERYDQPYILFLFYLKYPPAKFQNDHELTPRDEFGFSTVRSFDKYEFRIINYDDDRPNLQNTLIAGTDEDIPKHANVVKEIFGINGRKYFDVVAN